MLCLFGHKWKNGKCTKCGATLGKVADGFVQKKDWKKLAELMRSATKENKYGLVDIWEPLALRFFMESDKAPLEECLEILYEHEDKNTFAFLLGLTHTSKAASFLSEKLDGKHLGNFFKGHGVALHDLANVDTYEIVRKQCSEYSIDNAAPFYYALGAYKKQEDIEAIITFILRFIQTGKHSWGFSDSLRFAVAGLAEIGGQTAFDALLEVENFLRENNDSKANLYEHRAVVLYGLYLISRGNAQMTDRLLDILTLDVGQDVYNSYQQYILAQVRGAESRVKDYALNRLNTLMEGPCNRYTGTDCEAVYCMYVLGRNGWQDYTSIRPKFEEWLEEYDRYMITYVDKFFAAPEDNNAQKEMLSHSSLQSFGHIESNLHEIRIAFLPRMNKHLGCTVLLH